MFEDYYMPEFDADYFNSPAFQRGIAAAVQQYSPQPAEPVYYAPEPVYYAPPPAPEITAGIGDIPQYMVDDYGLIGGAPDRFTAPQISDEQLAAERYAADQAAQQAEAQRVAAEQAAAEQAAAQQAAAAAEAQRVAAEQEYFARVEAERVAAERAAAAEAAAQRQQTELNERRAQAAQAAAERAAQERAFAEQVAAQAAAEAQAAVQAQAQAAAQAEAQRVAAERAQAEAQAAAQVEAQRVAAEQAQAEQARVQAEQAAAVAPAPEPVVGIGRRGGEDYYQTEFKIPDVYAPQPEPVYYAPEPEIYRGIGDGLERNFYDADRRYPAEDIYTPAVAPVTIEAEPIRAPAVEPMTIEAEPIAGIGSPFVAETAAAPSLIETAAAAPAADTGLQVINANDYSPSETDLQTMGLSRDQWNETMAQLSTIDLGNLNFGNFGVTSPGATNNFRTFTAPKSNKGNPTSTVAKKDNTFNVIENQPIRLVDMRTKKVVFQGTGYEAAEKAIELAAGLTKAGGNKADWEIQTGQFKNPGSGDLSFGDTFKTVANEKRNTSIFNQALDIIGDAALGFIIGGPVGAAIAAGASAAGVNVSDIAYPIIATAVLGPVGPAATAGAAALGSAVSSAVQGRSIEETLIRAGVTAVTAGVMSGTDIGGDISEAVGGVLKDIGVESQVGNIVSGIGGSGTVDAVTGDIVVTAATKAAEKALEELAASTISGVLSSTVGSSIVDAVQQVVPDYQPSPETNAALNKLDEAAATAATAAADPTIVVTANPVTTAVSGANPIVETAAGIAGGFTNVGDIVDSPELRDRIAEEKARVEEPKEEIVVEATRPVEPPPAEPAPEVAGIGGPIPSFDPNAPIVVEATRPVEPPPAEPAPEVAGIGGAIEPIVVTAPKVVQPPPEEPEVTGTPIPGVETLIKSPEFQEDLADEKAGEEKEKSTFEKVKDAVDIATTVLPIVGGVVGGGGGGDDGPLVPSGGRYDVNPNRSDIFGMRRPATIGFNPFTYGQATGDQPGEYLFFTRDPVTGAPTIPAPITTPTANEPAGPAMILPSDNTFAEGGEVDDDMAAHLMAYHKNGGHTGPGQVKGIGSGQEDKIPAWLSDGEYVWSAQDVADLGDGSTDEGVRRLDKMRQMVRRRAGRKDVKKIAKPQKGIDHMLKAVGGSV